MEPHLHHHAPTPAHPRPLTAREAMALAQCRIHGALRLSRWRWLGRAGAVPIEGHVIGRLCRLGYLRRSGSVVTLTAAGAVHAAALG